MILARKKRSTSQHLGEDAPRTPDIDLDVVLLPCQHDLGGTVVPRRDVAGHLGVLDTGEAKVADLEVAVFVDEDVARFEVAVDDAGGMDILEASLDDVRSSSTHAEFRDVCREAHEDLVEKVLYELLFQRPGGEQSVEVGAEQLCDEVSAASQSQQMGAVMEAEHVHVFERRDEDVA